MRPVSIENVLIGDRLGKSIFGEQDELLLAAGYQLTEEMLALIHRRGFRTLYIFEDEDDDLQPEEIVSDTVRRAVTRSLASLHEVVRSRLNGLPLNPMQLKQRLKQGSNVADIIPMGDVTNTVNSLVGEVLDSNLGLLSALPMKSDVDRVFEHAMDTAVVAVLIGQYFSYEYKELKALATAALLHDIGKVPFGDLQHRTPSRMSRQERWTLREHPVYSMLMLKGSSPESFLEQTAVLEHHERPDGSGYPQNLRSKNDAPLKSREKEPGLIFRHAEILAVANAYDNLVSGVTDGRVHTPQSAVSVLVTGAGTSYNPHVLRALTKVVQFYPTGSHVRILNTFSGSYVGYRGIIRQANPEEYAKPILTLTHDDENNPVKQEDVDLGKERAVYLELLL